MNGGMTSPFPIELSSCRATVKDGKESDRAHPGGGGRARLGRLLRRSLQANRHLVADEMGEFRRES